MPAPFRRPRPSRPLMGLLGYLNRSFLLLGLPVLRCIPWIRDLPGIRGYFWLRAIDLPPRDRERLGRTVNPATAAFMAPNHPEFGFDWMIDKEVSTLIAPRMASWAAHEVVAGAPWFWLRNNLVSNAGGKEAQAYSIETALRGDGVLLHPEGSVHWTRGHIHPLFPGVADMACAAARSAGPRPVYIVPIVWVSEYVSDITAALHREMGFIERSLGLPSPRSCNVAQRFQSLSEAVLDRQMRAFGFDPAWVAGLDFFARQDAFRDWLIEDLDARHDVRADDSIERHLARLRRAIPRDNADDRARADEGLRLCGFSRERYGAGTLSKEQIAESLKRHRATLLRRGFRNVLHNLLPRPYGPRLLRMRVPEPILIDSHRAETDVRAYTAELLATLRARMQATLDELVEAKSLHSGSTGLDKGMLNHGSTRNLERHHRLRNDQCSGQALLGR